MAEQLELSPPALKVLDSRQLVWEILQTLSLGVYQQGMGSLQNRGG